MFLWVHLSMIHLGRLEEQIEAEFPYLAFEGARLKSVCCVFAIPPSPHC